MPRFRVFAALSLLLLLLVPAIALANVRRGTYIEVKTGRERFQRAAAVAVCGYSIESPRLLLNSTSKRFPHGLANNLLTKALKITDGKFSFNGKSTLRGLSQSVIKIKVTGTFGKGKITGKITYLDAPAPCTTRSYSAKYYGVNPQG